MKKEVATNLKSKLAALGLDTDNAVVIGSGIMSALDIRESGDIDVVTTKAEYGRLASTNQFKITKNHGREILTDDLYEIGTSWGVIGKDRDYDNLYESSTIIDGVRYITLDFLLRVKKSWCEDDDVRQKDIDDVSLIEKHLKETDQ
jgi:hypothetical protein